VCCLDSEENTEWVLNTSEWVLNTSGTRRQLSGERDYTRNKTQETKIDNISTWTKLSVEGSVRMTNDRDQLRNYIHGV